MKKLISESLDPREQWNKVYDLVYNVTLEHKFNEYELKRYIDNMAENSKEFEAMNYDEIEDAAWAAYEDAQKYLE